MSSSSEHSQPSHSQSGEEPHHTDHSHHSDHSKASSSDKVVNTPGSASPRPPTYDSGAGSPAHGGTTRHRTLHRGRGHSSSSSSDSTPESSGPYSVRAMSSPDLDAVIVAHLDQMARKLRHADYHHSHLRYSSRARHEFQWQLFLGRTRMCPARGPDGRVEEEVSAPGPGHGPTELLLRGYQQAAANEHRARRKFAQYEGQLTNMTTYLCKLLREKDRRRMVARRAGRQAEDMHMEGI